MYDVASPGSACVYNDVDPGDSQAERRFTSTTLPDDSNSVLAFLCVGFLRLIRLRSR